MSLALTSCLCLLHQSLIADVLPTVKVPIEVMGPPGSTASVSILADSNTLPVLCLRVHGLEDEKQASVRINNGRWIPLDNAHCQIVGPGLAGKFGDIGSSPITLFDLKIPFDKDLLNIGQNTLFFRFNASNGINSSYRVLGVHFENGPNPSYVWDDPTTWKPPLNDSKDIAEGKALWSGASLIENFNGPPIKAHCDDCHATDGRDLKYFNYSNYSIIVRSMFHGLSYKEGQQIASYIRSLPASYGSKYGRPWNPPYQPGPGLDSHGPNEWAAGAGIDAVLPNEDAMLPHLFPTADFSHFSTPQLIQALLKVTNVHGTLNMRELPIALPLPDWNHWLPTIAPVDGTNFYAQPNSTSPFVKNWPSRYQSIVQNLQTQGKAYLVKNLGMRPDGQPQTASPFAVDEDSWVIGALTPLPPFNPNITTDAQKAAVIYSLAQWRMVRAWEIQQAFNLDTQGQLIFGNQGSSTNNRIEPLTWANPFAFDTAPKALHVSDGALRDAQGNKIFSAPTPLGGSWAGNQYLDDAWYWMQLILNPGNGKGSGNDPVDWGYIPFVIMNTGTTTGESSWIRLVAQVIKGSQERDNGIGYVPITLWDGPAPGWDPWRVDYIYALFYGLGSHYGATSLTSAQRGAILDAMIQSWLAKNKEYTPEQWFTPWQTDEGKRRDNSMNPNALPVYYSGTFEGQVYTWLLESLRAGVSQSTTSAVVQWLNTMWPMVDWDTVAFNPAATGYDHSKVPLKPVQATAQ